MNIIKDLNSIRHGESKAARDIHRVNVFEAEHQRRHTVDEDYDCHPASREFYAKLGEDVKHSEDLFEVAGYRRIMAEWGKEIQAERAARNEGPEITFIPIEPMAEGETQEQFHARIHQSIIDAEQLEGLVSETDDKPDQQEGK